MSSAWEHLVETGAIPSPEPPAQPVEGQPVGLDGLHLTELGNANRLVALFGDQFRYVAEWGQWLRWDGMRWATDHQGVHVHQLASELPHRMWADIAETTPSKARDNAIKWARRSESNQTITATVKLARSVPGVAVDHLDLDSNPMLINAINGTMDLITGEFREHRPDDLLTKVTNANWDHNAECPMWIRFLTDVLPAEEVRSFLRRCAGYSMTGDVSEQILLLLVGEGANGKSTLIETITYVLGGYAGIAAKDLLVSQRHDPHPTSMADLFGARLAVGSETEETDTLAEAKVKQLTGGDTVKARRMREDFWTYEPTHKLWIATNHLPRIQGRDHAIWRRIRVIPFEHVVADEDQDKQLKDKLRSEADGILRWLVDGCQAWLEHGLTPPQIVADSVAEYRASQDWFTRFIDESDLELGGTGKAFIWTAELSTLYRSWCSGEDLQPLSTKALAAELRSRGCEDDKASGKRIWRGIWKSS